MTDGLVLEGRLQDLGSVQRDSFSWRYDLAKLNLKCHMSYSIISTEITFYPESSILT